MAIQLLVSRVEETIGELCDCYFLVRKPIVFIHGGILDIFCKGYFCFVQALITLGREDLVDTLASVGLVCKIGAEQTLETDVEFFAAASFIFKALARTASFISGEDEAFAPLRYVLSEDFRPVIFARTLLLAVVEGSFLFA